MELRGDEFCFACGQQNPIGLKLVFSIDPQRRVSETRFTPRREHQGYEGITHGGILTTVLDEAMIKLCWSLGIPAVTAKLEVRLKKAVPVGAEIVVRGWIEEDKGRTLQTRAEATDAAGDLVAAASATAVVQGRR